MRQPNYLVIVFFPGIPDGRTKHITRADYQVLKMEATKEIELEVVQGMGLLPYRIEDKKFVTINAAFIYTEAVIIQISNGRKVDYRKPDIKDRGSKDGAKKLL